ncbi:Glucuronosyltransferase [Aphelenchoides fujianensis]|nr:Glucuronosyltransferase [Aphelenchoides fujianensis]
MFKMAAWGDAFEQEMTATDWAGFDRLQAMYCESLLTDYALIRDLREANYDVAMAESFDRCAFALFRHLRILSTHVMSAIPLDEWTAHANGVPVDLLNTPIMFNNRQFTPLSSTWERLRNVYEYLRWRFHYMPESMRVVDSAIRKVFGADFPNSLELLGSVDYVWLNTNEHVAPARLLSARIKSIGGIAVDKERALNEPMVVVPFFGDQHMNSAAAVGRGIAVAVDRRRLSADGLVVALRRVLHDPAIRAAAADVRRKIRSAPVDPAVLFAKTVEFAAENAGLRELHLPTTSAWDHAAVWSAIGGGLLFLSVVAFWTLRTAFALLSLVRRSFLFAAERAKKVE